MIDYISSSWYVTFCIEVVFGGIRAIAWSQFRIRVSAVYSCPCKKTGTVKSRPMWSKVKPWQPLNVEVQVEIGDKSGRVLMSIFDLR